MAQSNTYILTPTGGTASASSGSTASVPATRVSKDPLQIIGLNPLRVCNFFECRSWVNDCYVNPVFGTIGATGAAYENDVVSFIISDALRRALRFRLYKFNHVSGQYDLVQANMGASYGVVKNFGTFIGHPTYAGIFLNWGSVLSLHGVGIYRVSIASLNSTPNQGNRFVYCLVSEAFRLLEYECKRADRTVKFEAYQSGIIGSITDDGTTFNLCGLNIYDSIRVPGFFGMEKSNYNSVELEYTTGLIDLVHDEIQQKFKFESRLLPKWCHDRLKTYGLMADSTYVSDYNWMNADYFIKSKRVRVNGSYEPKYNERNRLATVTVEFKEGIEGVIKSISCPK